MTTPGAGNRDEEKSPEQLLSEALRAKAVQAPPPAAPDPGRVPPDAQPSLFADSDASFELLSGHDYRLPAPESPEPTAASTVPERETAAPLGVGWVLLIALLLGCAAGAVAGLLTLR